MELAWGKFEKSVAMFPRHGENKIGIGSRGRSSRATPANSVLDVTKIEPTGYSAVDADETLVVQLSGRVGCQAYDLMVARSTVETKRTCLAVKT